MPLAAGTRLGAYDIVALIGAGGMGEVYRARDTRLKREVAIKVLPDAFANDPERLARFQREAELLATLNHPNIGAVYGFEQSQNASAIVLELVEGETLADRIQRAPISVKEALQIALQIAEALEAAHERGVIHRDLKPANIKITGDDKVKVLDFGLAKLADPPSVGRDFSRADLSHSPTLSMMATQAGMILGTAAYMSPEQAKGLAADHRSDVFSFGVVLYEMLTAHQPFRGDTAHEVIASVLVREPDFTLLPANLNPRLKEVVQRCLEKNPRKRFHAIADVSAEIERARLSPVAALAETQHPSQRRIAMVAGACSLAAAIAAGSAAWLGRPDREKPIVARFSISLPETFVPTRLNNRALAISPDGTHIVFADSGRLHLRSLSETRVRTIAGSETEGNIGSPVFSPDGLSIVYTNPADRLLKRISVAGGAAVTLARIPDPLGVTWSETGILIGQGSAGIVRISPHGGTPEQLVKVESDEQAYGPQLLPDGDSLLFTLARGRDSTRWDKADVVVQSIKSGVRHTVVSGGADAQYLPTGHLIYVLGGAVYAAAFDVASRSLKGGAVSVIDGVARPSTAQSGASQLSVSATGSLIYVPGPSDQYLSQRFLAFLNRTGALERINAPAAWYDTPRISPDGRLIAVTIEASNDAHIWLIDPSGVLAPRRLTFGGRNRHPLWTRDGQRVAFQSDREGDLGIFWQRADGAGLPERLTTAERGVEHRPDDWLPDGSIMAFTAIQPPSAKQMLLNLKKRSSTVFADAPSRFVSRAAFSPDGKWIAYSSDENGRLEVFVQPFPPTGARYQIGSAAATSRGVSWWSPDGKELFFNEGPTRWFAVKVSTAPTFTFGPPREIPRLGLPNQLGSTGPRNYDQTPDGTRMVVVTESDPARAAGTPQIQVVLNWFEELKQRVPLTRD